MGSTSLPGLRSGRAHASSGSDTMIAVIIIVALLVCGAINGNATMSLLDGFSAIFETFMLLFVLGGGILLLLSKTGAL